MKKCILILIMLCCGCSLLWAQNPYGTTGLLRMPTADFQDDGTFMFGNTFLPKEGTKPNKGKYDTFNYFFNVTFFPFMEVAYTLTMNKGVPGDYWPKQTWGKFVNQDRSFHLKLRVWKEGWYKWWTPQIAIGANDPLTHSAWGGGDINFGESGPATNNYFTRWFVAMSKHVNLGDYGVIGAHVAWVLGRGKNDAHYSRPAVGVQYRFNLGAGKDPLYIDDSGSATLEWWQKAVNGLSLMAEYDARTFNIGMWYDFPAIVRKADGSDRFTISAYLEMNQCKYATAGILFKIHLAPCVSVRRDYRIGAPGIRPFEDEFGYFKRKKEKSLN